MPSRPVMESHIQTPPAPRKNPLGRDTGFPEPLCEDRNTTLTHPDADTSPNATIEANVNTPRTHPHRFFLGRHHATHAKTSAFHHKELEKSGLYDNIQYADGSKEEKSVRELQSDGLSKVSSEGSSLDGRDEKNGRLYNHEEREKALYAKLPFS